MSGGQTPQNSCKAPPQDVGHGEYVKHANISIAAVVQVPMNHGRDEVVNVAHSICHFAEVPDFRPRIEAHLTPTGDA